MTEQDDVRVERLLSLTQLMVRLQGYSKLILVAQDAVEFETARRHIVNCARCLHERRNPFAETELALAVDDSASVKET